MTAPKITATQLGDMLGPGLVIVFTLDSSVTVEIASLIEDVHFVVLSAVKGYAKSPYHTAVPLCMQYESSEFNPVPLEKLCGVYKMKSPLKRTLFIVDTVEDDKEPHPLKAYVHTKTWEDEHFRWLAYNARHTKMTMLFSVMSNTLPGFLRAQYRLVAFTSAMPLHYFKSVVHGLCTDDDFSLGLRHFQDLLANEVLFLHDAHEWFVYARTEKVKGIRLGRKGLWDFASRITIPQNPCNEHN